MTECNGFVYFQVWARACRPRGRRRGEVGALREGGLLEGVCNQININHKDGQDGQDGWVMTVRGNGS